MDNLPEKTAELARALADRQVELGTDTHKTQPPVPNTIIPSDAPMREQNFAGGVAEGGNIELAKKQWLDILNELRSSYGGRFTLDHLGNLVLSEGAAPGQSPEEAVGEFGRLDVLVKQAKVILGTFEYSKLFPSGR